MYVHPIDDIGDTSFQTKLYDDDDDDNDDDDDDSDDDDDDDDENLHYVDIRIVNRSPIGIL